MPHTCYSGGYREAQGVRYFTTLGVRCDDVATVEVELSDLQLHERLADKSFAKP